MGCTAVMPLGISSNFQSEEWLKTLLLPILSFGLGKIIWFMKSLYKIPNFFCHRDNTPHVKDPSPDWSVIFSSLRNVSSTIRKNFPNTSKNYIFAAKEKCLIFVLDQPYFSPNSCAWKSWCVSWRPLSSWSWSLLSRIFDVRYIFFIVLVSLKCMNYFDSCNFTKWWSNGNFDSFLNRDGGWNELLDKQAQESFGKCGFYSLNVTPELKVLEICFFLLISSVFRKFSLLGCHPEHKLVQWTQQFDSQPRRSLWAAEMVWTSTWGSSIKEVQSTLI